MTEFHVRKETPNDVWPRGAWSLFRITGDEIARRIIYADGKVVRRDSWPGYVGMYETKEQLMAAMVLACENVEVVDTRTTREKSAEAVFDLYAGKK